MKAPIEAQSLSSLNHLFSNPPHYPRNPTHQVNDPLVLYIVRVPGSKDVVLTPLKPPTRESISLEAIQTSLYYLHVPTPEDEAVRSSIDQQRSFGERPVKPVIRKALPPTPYANYPSSERPPLPPRSYPHFQPGPNGPHDTQAERLAARGSNICLKTSDEISKAKPAGPRQLPQQRVLEENSTSKIPVYPPPFGFFGDRPSSGSTTSSRASAMYEEQDLTRQSVSPARSPLPEQQFLVDQQAFSVTLIRRDPASGGQWNVGTINEVTSAGTGSKIHPVSVGITTPGYVRFTEQQETSMQDSVNLDGEFLRQLAETAQITPIGNTAHSFTRTVDYRPQPTSRNHSSKPQRTNSFEVPSISPSTHSNPEKNVLSFMSPWQGMCTFSNGVDGRSLRCKHTISTSGLSEGLTANVAELRFNLPWSVLGTKDHGKQFREEPDKLPIPKLLESKKENFRRSIQQLKHRSFERKQAAYDQHENVVDVTRDMTVQASSNVENETDRISLRLGRENAGGGYKGKSAKLGKLIIEDEGLKMCDLVVAACMGVWWQHYQNRSG